MACDALCAAASRAPVCASTAHAQSRRSCSQKLPPTERRTSPPSSERVAASSCSQPQPARQRSLRADRSHRVRAPWSARKRKSTSPSARSSAPCCASEQQLGAGESSAQKLPSASSAWASSMGGSGSSRRVSGHVGRSYGTSANEDSSEQSGRKYWAAMASFCSSVWWVTRLKMLRSLRNWACPFSRSSSEQEDIISRHTSRGTRPTLARASAGEPMRSTERPSHVSPAARRASTVTLALHRTHEARQVSRRPAALHGSEAPT
mmetsp:Transcript_19600/g.65876  ORF Transcript_19600/g.65876 Transcript_19600/m.65876 type:complete len:263 (-) Transcript_19600:324-1112(-)